MQKKENKHFEKLREKYPLFIYHAFHYQWNKKNQLEISFDFSIGEAYHFTPKMLLKTGKYFAGSITPETLEGIVFHIGMIELVSYWKATCSPEIYIKPYKLNHAQQMWWSKLYRKGLSEFFYQNGIELEDSFFHFLFNEDARSISELHYQRIENEKRSIVPVGGGKDSVVSLEKLSNEQEIIPFIINPRGATLDCVRIAGFAQEEDIVILERSIDAQLLQLNKAGFLNGHTPFSAMLAFYSLLVASLTDTRPIALSNESSANEATIINTDINHQYSKSLEFEEDFRKYVTENMNDVAHYYSYLRPYSELEIAEMFSQYPQYFMSFRSCNAGSKQNVWCCNCPKCLFAYIILAPFIEKSQMIRIFGENLLDKPSLQSFFDELTGKAETKPFECVGTVEEVNKALEMLNEKSTYAESYLLQQ
jgi:hypothetical protein